MPGTAGPAPRADARTLRRFGLLRAAQLALGAARGVELAPAAEELARSLSARLREPGRGPEGSTRPAGAGIDADLDAYQGVLSAALEGLSFAELQRWVSGEPAPRRMELISLLSLCLEAEPELDRALHKVDFLITSLCISLREGRFRVERDPVQLLDAVTRRCQGSPVLAAAERDAVIAEFEEGARLLEAHQDCVGVARRLADYKAEVAPLYFCPEILRSIVRYNAAARNQFLRVGQRRAGGFRLGRRARWAAAAALALALGLAAVATGGAEPWSSCSWMRTTWFAPTGPASAGC